MTDLGAHRIARIEQGDLVSHYPRMIGRNSHLGSHGTGHASRYAVIHTDGGAAGWGLLRGPLDDGSALIGRAVADLFDPTTGVTDAAANVLDIALHDLAGVLLGQPVYRMLGADGATDVPCYSGAIYMDDLDPEEDPDGTDAVLRNCAQDHDAGYRAFKLKIGRGYRWMTPEAGLERDIAVTRLVREAYPDLPILVDGNNGFTGPDFLTYLDAVRDCGLFWVEEPFQEDRADLAALSEQLRHTSPATLIADGELDPDVPFLLDLAREGLLDVLLMDIVSFGMTAWRRLMPELRGLGVMSSPHAWGDPIKSLYTAQLAARLGDDVTVEAVPGTTDGIDTSGYVLRDGRLHVPDLPGFGIAPPSPSASRAATPGGLGSPHSRHRRPGSPSQP